MATYPLKTIFGKLLGLTRPTSTYPTERLFVKGGVITPYLFVGTSEGSENLADIQDWTKVEASSTGTAALATRGITQITSAASTLYTLAAPPGTGVRKTLFTTSTSTLSRQVLSASPIVTGLAASGGDGTITASTSMTVMTFNALGQSIELVSLSTSAWVNVGLRGYSTGVAALSS
jgi:hypothetical protein